MIEVIRRGDLITVAVQGDFGKPRPALVVQSDLFLQMSQTVSVLLLSTRLVQAPIFRITVVPDKENGLRETCQIQVDKIVTVRKSKIGPIFGKVSNELMMTVNRSMALFLGF